MSMSNATRREILRRMSALSCVGAAASTFGLQLATMGSAAAQTPSTYKALVCLFMFGGNDANNMVLATDSDSWGRYFSTRQQGSPIALMPVGTPATAPGATNSVTGRTLPSGNSAYQFPEAWGGVLPISTLTSNPIPPGTSASVRTFAINPLMAALIPVWNAGRLAAAVNVGPLIQPITKTQMMNRTAPLPENLMSHNDQQSTWQSGSGEGARQGWGGSMADQLLASNGANAVFTAISTSGNAVLLAGQNVVQYQMSTNQSGPAIRFNVATGSSQLATIAREIVRDTSGSSYFMNDYSSKVIRSQGAADLLNAQFTATGAAAAIPDPTQMLNPITRANETNPLATQLQTVAKVIASNQVLGIRRQVFFVSIGGFDTHSDQNLQQAPLLARVAHAMAYFDGALANVGGVDMRNLVTTFTASDFSRTFTTNGDGTDHAWGSHQFVMGGAVRGGDVYGQFPTIGVDDGSFQNPNILNNIMIPQMSVDQYAGTMARWFGISDSQIAAIFPNIPNFTNRYLNFLPAGTV